MFINARAAAARYHEESLIGAAMLVVRAAFRISGREHHFGALRAPVADADAKAFAEFKFQVRHEMFSIL